MIRLATIVITVLALSACGPAVSPTLMPAPTAAPTGPTGQPPTQAATTPPSAETPPPTPTAPGSPLMPTASSLPEAIAITQPQIKAGIVSPAHIEGEADPAFEQTLAINILDVNGQVVGQGTAHINADAGRRGPFSADVPFSVTSEGPGRIIVYTTSARDGSTVHLNSVEVQLKPSGNATPGIAASPLIESIAITSPAAGSNLTRTVTISGEAAPTFEQQLSVLIRDATGNVVGTGSTTIKADVGQRGPFSLTLTYTVAAPGPGRVVVYDTSPRDGGIIHLASVEVMLNP